MKVRFSPFIWLALLVGTVGLACMSSTPTPLPPTQTPDPTVNPADTETPIPTSPPTATPTPTELPPTTTAILPTSTPERLNFTSLPAYTLDEIFLTADPLAANTLYLILNRTVYQSLDGGNGWTALGSDQIPQIPASVLNLLLQQAKIWRIGNATIFGVDPQTPTTLYGIVEGDTSLDFAKSTDGGQTWLPLQTPLFAPDMLMAEGMAICVVSPLTPETIFISDPSKIYKSADGGASWGNVTTGIPDSAPSGFWNHSLVFIPYSPATVYFLDPLHGIYQSMDGGESWKALNRPQNAGNWLWLVVDPLDANKLYADSNMEGRGLLQSLDGGQTWTETDLGLPASDVYAFAIDPTNPSIRYTILAAGETSGLFKSVDGGQVWTEIAAVLLPTILLP